MEHKYFTINIFQNISNQFKLVFSWPYFRLNVKSKTILYNYMVSSNHKVLPLGKHKKGIGNPGNREFGETLGNRQLRGIGNAGNRECVGNAGIRRGIGEYGNVQAM